MPSEPVALLQEATDGSGDRVRAQRFSNPSFTVPIGTVMPAILETALDSTRSGSARAIIQQNIHGFDGRRILIPRGSRLYGEYQGDLQPGQNRALVTWTRLMRPDGVTIALNSDAFALWNLDMEEVVEPGLFDIMVGPDSENLQTVTLEII